MPHGGAQLLNNTAQLASMPHEDRKESWTADSEALGVLQRSTPASTFHLNSVFHQHFSWAPLASCPHAAATLGRNESGSHFPEVQALPPAGWLEQHGEPEWCASCLLLCVRVSLHLSFNSL